MSPSVRIDEEVYSRLQKIAEPFVDTPNSVLRRLLHLDETGESPVNGDVGHEAASLADGRSPRSSGKEKPVRKGVQRRKRAAAGSLLSEDEFVAPLLSALVERGGSVTTQAAVDAVGEKLKSRLTSLDLEETASGPIRWMVRLQFLKSRLAQEGLISTDAPRGVWQITDDGRSRLVGQVETNGGD